MQVKSSALQQTQCSRASSLSKPLIVRSAQHQRVSRRFQPAMAAAASGVSAQYRGGIEKEIKAMRRNPASVSA